MVSKISRYRNLPDVVTEDLQGRSVESKSLRLLPEVTGRFLHTVEAGDRLDHLAHQYYKQPRKWWRICDANPAVLSPLALLGNEPLATRRFPLAVADIATPPPWAALRQALRGIVGVVDVQIEEAINLAPEIQIIDDRQVTVVVEVPDRSVVVTYNELVVGESELAAHIEDAGFLVGPPAAISPIGQTIVIPPDVVR